MYMFGGGDYDVVCVQGVLNKKTFDKRNLLVLFLFFFFLNRQQETANFTLLKEK